jgi:hypothetical protein
MELLITRADFQGVANGPRVGDVDDPVGRVDIELVDFGGHFLAHDAEHTVVRVAKLQSPIDCSHDRELRSLARPMAYSGLDVGKNGHEVLLQQQVVFFLGVLHENVHPIL